MERTKKQGDWQKFFQLLRDTKPSKWRLSIALLLSVLSTFGGLIIPLFTKDLVDSFSMDTLNQMTIVVLVVAFVAQAIASGFSIYFLNYVGQSIVASLRKRLWTKFLRLPISYYDQSRTGDMISRMTNDTSIVKNLITDHVTGFFTGIISIIGSVAILLYLDWKMTIIMLTAVPLTLMVLFPLGAQMYKISKGLQDETASFTAKITQVLAEIRLVKSSNAERIEKTSGETGIRKLFRFGLREGKVQAFISPLVTLVLMAMLVIIIGYGGVRVSSGVLSAGDLVAFILYLFQIMMPMVQFSTFFTELQKAKGATERIIETLKHPEEDFTSGDDVTEVNVPIVAEGLTFGYEDGQAVLQDLHFTIQPGKVTAIVGPSGSGKTTLFSLLERFYEPDEGTIYFGSTPIDQFSLRSWRRLFGYVSQESPIVAGTIRENICYGLEEDVSEDALREATKMAYADKFIQAFPEGYETEVGERGIKLSGGQRQRIGIARALLRDPTILMLDEATSSLDSQSEIYVQKALQNLMRGRTTLVIAHRLSTVVNADQILFLDKGKLTGVGTHAELYATHEKYRTFATQQLLMKESNERHE